MKKILDDPISKMTVARVSVRDVDAWVLRMRQAKVGAGALQNRYAFLRGAFEQAVRWEWITHNAVRAAKVAAITARSVALAGFGLDSLVEIGASTVVLWELSDTSKERRSAALRLIGVAFVCLSIYVATHSTVVLLSGYHARHSPVGIGWTAMTAVAMFSLARAKRARVEHWTTRFSKPKAR